MPRTRRRPAPALLALGVLALGPVLGGCAAQRVEVEPDDGAVTLGVGEVLVVEMGEVSSSIGDDWDVDVEPDPAVLGTGEQHVEDDGEVAPGSGVDVEYRFAAVGEGTTSITFQYAYRGSTDDADTRQRVDESRLVLEVTVEQR